MNLDLIPQTGYYVEKGQMDIRAIKGFYIINVHHQDRTLDDCFGLTGRDVTAHNSQ